MSGRQVQPMNQKIVDGYAGGIPFIVGDIVTTTGTYTTVEKMPFRARILDVVVEPTANNAGGTVRLYKVTKAAGGTAATAVIVSDAIAAAVVDTQASASTLDADYQVVEEGEGLQLRSANAAAARVGILLVRWDG